MRNPDPPQATPDWSLDLTGRCRCTCRCATVDTWRGHEGRWCGCCPSECTTCTDCVPDRAPLLWQGDDA